MPTTVPATPPWVIAALAAACIVGARLLGRYLPRGVPDAALAVSLSGTALWGMAASGAFGGRWVGLAAALLCVAWVAAGVAVGWRGGAKAGVRRRVFRHVGGLCGAAAGGVLLTDAASAWSAAATLPAALYGAPGAGRWTGVLAFVLLAVAARLGIRRRDDEARSGPVWLLMAAGVAALSAGGRPAAALGLAAAGAGLGLVVVEGLLRWRGRGRAGITTPGELLDERLGSAGVSGGALVLALLGMSGCAAGVGAAVAPLTAFAAALAAFNVFHRRGWRMAGEVGLAGVMLTWVAFVAAWLPWPGARPVERVALGLACGALHVAWLSRFWRQQLCDGRPWTTAGRLVPMARGTTGAASLPMLAAAIACVLGASDGGLRTMPLAAALAAWLLAIRIPKREGFASRVAGARWVLIGAAALMATTAFPLRSDPPAAIAAACGLSVLLAGAPGRTGLRRPVRGNLYDHAWYLGVLPIGGALALILAAGTWSYLLFLFCLPLLAAPVYAVAAARNR